MDPKEVKAVIDTPMDALGLPICATGNGSAIG